MLVENTQYINRYTANGSTTEFPISFPFLDPTHIRVYRRRPNAATQEQVQDTEYTITGTGSESGGTLTFNTAPVSGTVLAFVRNVPITQLYNYTELDNFPAESHENALAKLTMICQELKEENSRSIKVPETEAKTPEELWEEFWEAYAAVMAAAASVRQAAFLAESVRNAAFHTPNQHPLFEMLDVGGDRPGLYDDDPAKWGFTLQAPFCDTWAKILYFSREATYSGGPQKELLALQWSEKTEERVLLGRSARGGIVAHQNNAIYRPTPKDEPLLFFPNEPYDNGAHAPVYTVRIYKHEINNGIITFSDPVRELTLWDNTWTPDTLLRFCISADMRWMISEAVKNADGKRYRRVWDIASVMSGSMDDITNTHIVYEYEKPTQIAAGGQGIFSDGEFIYSLSGSTVTYMSCDTVDGRNCWNRPKIKGSDVSTEYEGETSKFEPEGVFWAPYNGSIEMFYYTLARTAARYSQYFCMSIAGGNKLEGQDSIYTPVPSRQAKATDRVAYTYDTFQKRHPEGSAINADDEASPTWHYANGLVYTRRQGDIDTPYMVQDCDLAITPGWYYFGSGDSCVNRPWNNVGYLQVIRHSFSNWSTVQMAYRRSGSTRMAKRSSSGLAADGTPRWCMWSQVDAAYSETYEVFKARQQSKVPHVANTNLTPTGKPILVVVAGQSNAVGSSENSGPGNIYVTGKFFSAGSIENYSYWNETVEGEGGHERGDFVCTNPQWKDGIQDPMYPSNKGGLIPSLAERIAELKNRPLFVINVARNGTNCCEGYIPVDDDPSTRLIAREINPVTGKRDILISGEYNWYLSWAPSGWLRRRAKAIFETAINQLTAQGLTAGVDYDVLGTIWLQGEYDASYAYATDQGREVREGFPYTETLESYKTTLADTLDWLNTNLVVSVGQSTFGGTTYVLPIGYSNDKEVRPDAYTDAVNGIIDDVVTTYDGAGEVKLSTRIIPAFITSSGSLMASTNHYSQTGYDLLGYALAENIQGDITNDPTPRAESTNYAKLLSSGSSTLYFNPQNVSFSDGTLDNIAGECNVIKTAGKVIMIDVGGTNRTQSVISYLNEIGVERVDYLILSHYHGDHVGNITQQSNGEPVNSLGLDWAGCKIYLASLCDSRSAEYSSASAAKSKVEAFATAFGATTVTPAEGDTLTVGGATLTLLNCGSTAVAEIWALQDEANDNGLYAVEENGVTVKKYPQNDYSMCVDVRIGNVSVFYTGDIEYAGQKRLCNKGFAHPVDLLKFQHHGSNSDVNLPYYIPFADRMPARMVVVQNGVRSNNTVPRLEMINWTHSVILSPDLRPAIFESDGKTINLVQSDVVKERSKTIILNSGVNKLFKGDDFDNYTTPGTYTVMSGSDYNSIAHSPKTENANNNGYSGKLIVMTSSVDDYVYQIFITNTLIYVRNLNTTWSTWKRVMYTTASFQSDLAPNTTNTYNLGKAGYLWKEIYCANAAINTSDERLKSGITAIPNEVLDAWGDVNWAQFQMVDAVAQKGDAARLHTGLIAQRIRDAFAARGLDAARYGLYCYDEWQGEEAEYEEWDEVREDGSVVHHKDIVQEATHCGEIYGVRYTEALAMEAAYQRRRADKLEVRLAALEARVDLIETEA